MNLSISKKIFYGFGEFAGSCLYCLYYLFFLFFLTDIVGLPSSIAGTISMIGVLWDAVSDPLIGSISDNARFRNGRRRPFIIGFALPFGVSTCLLFTVFFQNTIFAVIYYTLIVILFFTCYTGYSVPYNALGAEISRDYNERTSIQSYRAIFTSIGTLIGASLPMFLAGYLSGLLNSKIYGWFFMSLLLGVVSSLSIYVSWAGTKKTEILWENGRAKNSYITVASRISSLFDNKALRYIIIVFFFGIMGHTLFGAMIVYFFSYYMEFGERMISITFSVSVLGSLVSIPLINTVAQKFGKRSAFIVFMILWIIVITLIFTVKPNNLFYIELLSFVYGVGFSSLWLLTWAMISDVVEVDEYLTGKRREGFIFGIAQFVQKIGAAIALWISGTVLTYSGYIPNSTQSEETLLYLRITCSFVVAILILFAAILIIFYPITEARHKALKEAIENKKR